MTKKVSDPERARPSLRTKTPERLDRAAELRKLYADLQEKLKDANGSGAAALGLQLRILAGELDQVEQAEVSKFDELADRRKTQAGPARPPSRRRKSG